MKRTLLMLLMMMPILTRAQTASFTVSTDTVCQDSCITLINTSLGPVDSIRWFINGVTFANPHADTITVCFPSAGIDSVRLYVYDTGRVDSTTKIVTIMPTPHPVVIVLGCEVMVPDLYDSYRWYNWGLIPGDTTNYVIGTSDQTFYVIVDSNGCSGRSNVGMACPLTVKNINNPSSVLTIFPNPVLTELTINSRVEITSVIIGNLLGQTIYTLIYNKDQVQVDVADLPAGMYLIRINGTEVRKFVKQ